MRTVLLITLATAALAGCGKDEKRAEERGAATSASEPLSPGSAAAPRSAAAEDRSASAVQQARPAARTAAPDSASGTYTVVKGDTLSGIAKTRGLSATDLARWNNISDPRRLRVGQQLRLTPP
jgi:LysM repeat protein